MTRRQAGSFPTLDNRFGEVGVSLKYVSARIERAARPAQAS